MKEYIRNEKKLYLTQEMKEYIRNEKKLYLTQEMKEYIKIWYIYKFKKRYTDEYIFILCNLFFVYI